MESLAPPSSSWYSEASKMSNSPVKDTPHDVVLAVTDLKKLIAWFSAGMVTAAIAALMHIQAQITDIQRHDGKQDISISQLTQGVQYSKDQLDHIQSAVELSQSNQSEILVQIAALRASGSATEEIARATQSRLERLADFLNRSTKATSAGVDSFDTIGRRMSQPPMP